MANTYTGIFLHIVFAVKNRDMLLMPYFRDRLYRYISSLIKEQGHTLVKIGGTQDHVHLLVRYNIMQTIPDLVRNLKSGSSRFINEQGFIACRFEWQRGYYVVSHSNRELDAIKGYIDIQVEHHYNTTLRQEMEFILSRFNIDYNPAYLLADI